MTRTDDHWRARWIRLAEGWRERATEVGLGGVVGAMQEGLRPLYPVAAQLLWVAQPTFSLLGEAEAISALAGLLEEPDTLRETADPAMPLSHPEGR